MKKTVYVILFFFISTSSILPQWILKNNGLPETWSHGWAIDACDINTAIISISRPILQYNVYITENAGSTWTDINAPNESAEDISIIDKDHIWIATATGKIYSTSDGGTNWNLQFHNEALTIFMNYIEMFDLNNGIAMGDGLSAANDPAVFLKTTDGGANWTSVNNTAFGGWSGSTWRRVDFVSPEVGYFYPSGVNIEQLYKTIDEGSTWNVINPRDNEVAIKFYNEMIGIVGYIANGGQYYIERTTDGGVTWTSFDTNFEELFPSDFEFFPNNPNCIWTANDEHFYFSADMAETWVEIELPEPNIQVQDIEFIDNLHGWLLCNDGKIYYTSNNASIDPNTITSVVEKNIPQDICLFQNYPNPFNPTTTISFKLIKQSHISLKIFDVSGQEITTLVNKELSAGTHRVQFNTAGRHGLASGIYFYTLQAGKYSATKKLLLIK